MSSEIIGNSEANGGIFEKSSGAVYSLDAFFVGASRFGEGG